MGNVKMIIGAALLLACSVSSAIDRRMAFRLLSYGDNKYELTSTWNSQTKEAQIRMGLVPYSIDGSLIDKNISFASAKWAAFVLLDGLEQMEVCHSVTHWSFEYTPDLPNLLMYVTLKGPGCQKLGEHLDLYRMRFRFVGLSLPGDEMVDVAVEVSR